MKFASLRGPSAIGMAAMRPEVFDEPLELVGAMKEGRVDFAVLPTTLAASLYSRGLDYRVAAVIVWGGLYVCGTAGSVAGIRDLSGKTVDVMAQGSLPEALLRHILVKSGLVPDRDVLFDHRFDTHASLADAAGRGISELCILPEPYLSQALAENPSLKIIFDLAQLWRQLEGYRPPVTSFLVKGALADADGTAVTDAVRSLKESFARAGESAAGYKIERCAFDVVEAGISGKCIRPFLKTLGNDCPDAGFLTI